MNLADYSLKNRTITWFFTFLLFVGGVWAYFGLGKLEDPSFTIKTAAVITLYPGASALDVENEVTEPIESAIQKMPQLDRVRSLSRAGMSLIYVDIAPKYTRADLPQIWDELRRKVSDVQSKMPPGAGVSTVNDAYGDVYGFYLALTGEEYEWNELEDVAKKLRRELLLVRGVSDVQLAGAQQEVVYVEIPRTRLAQLGVSPSHFFELLKAQNVVTPAGSARVGEDIVRVEPTGYFQSPEDIADLIVSGTGAGALRLRDIATVTRGYADPTQAVMLYNGRPAVGIGVSAVPGSNVIELGEALKLRSAELESQIPLGMNLNVIYYQSDTVTNSISNFMNNLISAVVIVIAILLLFMGLRSGLLIGGVLLLTILATFIAMRAFAIDMQSVSLGALIIALGMLVDNAIVIADGVLVGLQQRKDPVKAAKDIVKQTQIPLLGATIIAALCFAPIGTSPDNTGEFCRSLYQVVAISLLLSWVLAVTITPVASVVFLRAPSAEDKDPYDTFLYRLYRNFLAFCLRRRVAATGVMIVVLAASVFGFSFVKQKFFPSSTSPMFTVDFWGTPNTHIDKTLADATELQNWLLTQPETKNVTAYAGQGALRFILTYTAQDPGSNYGHLIVEAHSDADYQPLKAKILAYAGENMPHIAPQIRPFSKGSGGGAKIEARFLGDDRDVLRRLGEEALRIIKDTPDAVYVRFKWGERGMEIRPLLGDIARKSGLSRANVAQALQMAYSGATSGLYREDDKLLPIVSRLPLIERASPEGIRETQVWSPGAGRYIPLGEMVDGIETVAVDPLIYRRNRQREFAVLCDSATDETRALFSALRPRIEAIPLPEGVTLVWGGEHESSRDANAGLMSMIPLVCLFIVAILVMLFNGFRQPVIIVGCLPLSIIGVTAGFLISGKAFDFMAMLGFISLMGMMIKNAIVLLDQIDLEIGEGKPPFEAILSSGVSRVRPVMMAAFTTVLGVIPLYNDVLYGSLAVLIIFGLSFATLLTLVFVPVLCALWMRA
ncbi:MAG: efflux RND transporter permease subunit [Synergistaceae bacterium]|nr:efflux RND transporter permease subunit [Synergistaceae bacterium]